VFFMDEPTIGLDPESRSGVWQYVDELRSQEDITVFLTTHYMDEAERCDRIAIIDSGRIAAIDAPAALKGSVGSDTVRLESSDNARLERLIADRTGARTELLPTALNIYVPDGERFVPELFALGFQDAGLSIRSVSVQRPSLDDVFLAYTGNRFQDRQTAASRGGQSQ
jgi:ABC-2 type transport system ATP-binding protein